MEVDPDSIGYKLPNLIVEELTVKVLPSSLDHVSVIYAKDQDAAFGVIKSQDIYSQF